MLDFWELPFNVRPDLTPYIVHLTKRNDGLSAFKNLVNILETGTLNGSGRKGYVKGPNRAVCFMDIPFSALKYVINDKNSKGPKVRYEPCGIFLTKKWAYENGLRPVLYLSDDEIIDLRIPKNETWRVVKFEKRNQGWISWVHEREWRGKGDLELPTNVGVLVRSSHQVKRLYKLLNNPKRTFFCKPRAILPLSIVCQGLKYLSK